MLAYTYVEKGRFELLEKEKPELQDDRDAIVKDVYKRQLYYCYTKRQL